MGSLTKHQISRLMQEVEQQGITFEPLRSELIDHLISDIEARIEGGMDFPTAWLAVKSEIPQNHFKNIQQETMEILRKKFNVVHLFTFVSIGLLTLGALFKMLHLPGAAALLISFFISSCFTLLIGSGRIANIYRESKGRGAIWAITILIATLITGLCFKILHLPGANTLMSASTLSLLVLFSAFSLYFYLSEKQLRDHLLIRLIRDNQQTLERIALVLIGFGIVLNYGSVLFREESFSGGVFFIFANILIAMLTYSYTWTHYVESDHRRSRSNTFLLVASSIAFILFMSPIYIFSLFDSQELIFTIRHFSSFGALILFDLIVCTYYLWNSDHHKKKIMASLSTVLLIYPFIRLRINVAWYDIFMNELITSHFFVLGFLVFLIVSLIVFRRERLFRALIILTIATHMIPNL